MTAKQAITNVKDSILEFTRINAIRRLSHGVDVKRTEVFNLIVLGVFFAFLDGLGLTLLLPVLQYIQSLQSKKAYQISGGFIWDVLSKFMGFFHIPITLVSLLIMAFAPIALRQVIYFINAWYSARVSGKIAIRARMKALDTFYNADPDFYDRYGVGERVNVVMNLSTASGGAFVSVISFFMTILLVLIYVAILLKMSVLVTLCTLAAGVLVMLVTQANIRRIGAFSRYAARRTQEMYSKIVERMNLIRLVKMRDQKAQEKKFIEDFSWEMFGVSVKTAIRAATMEVTSQPLMMIAAFITLFVCVTLTKMGLPQIILIVYILTQIQAKISQINSNRQAITSNMASVKLLNETINVAAKCNNIRSGELSFTNLEQSIELSHVEFSYPELHRPDGTLLSSGTDVLKDITFTIPAGSFTAFVGRSGAGKSTLVELFARMRDANGGTILYDGHSIKSYQLGQLRRSIGYLTQQAMLFNDTVYNNLIYGLGFDPTDEQVRSALEGAYASFVYDLPQGLETNLGDSGVRFSGGERQRIGLARVLLEDTPILVLDEPTSALDSESEGYIQKALEKLHGKKTIIVIAHRLATVMKADQLFVMQDGEIVERGTHSKLIEQGQVYAKLFSSQLLVLDGLDTEALGTINDQGSSQQSD
ncbi:MAG: ABC transporter ATP-binding protein/permease [Coriobacteriia bacterium]|nr:ABC transporter ATP-binding protein/permease [Coriobacteriia bacterium]